MKSYFKLQYKLFNRKLVDVVFSPMVAYILLPLVFVGVSFLLFYRINFAAQYIYTFLYLCILAIGAMERNFYHHKYNCTILIPNCQFLHYITKQKSYVKKSFSK